MTILFLGTTIADLDAPALTRNTSSGFDAAYVTEGIQAAIPPDASNTFGIDLPTVTGVLWLHFEYFRPTYSLSTIVDGYFISFINAADQTVAGIDVLDDFQRANAVGDTNITGAGASWTSNARNVVDISVDVDNTDIVVNFYLNGVLVSTATAANTSGLKQKPTRIVFRNEDMAQTSYNAVFSQIIVTDGESTVGWRLAEMKPNGAGALSDWTGGHAALGDTDVGTAVSSDAANERLSMTLSSYLGPSSPAGIRGVFAVSRAQKGSGGPTRLNHFLRIAGVNYDGTGVVVPEPALPTRQIIHEWANNPATSVAWATADFAGIQLGLESEA